MRKTMEVKTLIRYINNRLQTSQDSEKENRKELMILAEVVLRETGNYCGFSYLPEEDVPSGYTVGIRYQDGVHVFEETDFTRIKYHTVIP